MLNWCSRFNICAFLDNHQYQLPGHRYECLAGCGAAAMVQAPAGGALQELRQFMTQHKDWCFGHLSYDLQMETDQVQSRHPDRIGFPDLCFFIPEYVLQLREQEICIGSLREDPELVLAEILREPSVSPIAKKKIPIRERVTKASYLQTVNRIRQHILRGDCYELNYCIEFYSDCVQVNPLLVYQSLTAISPNPFSVYYKVEDSHLLCASPERFLRKQGNNLLSQPIKGTYRRDMKDKEGDAILKEQLYRSEKDRSENVMVVDLVRNDLSKICREGSVRVDELFGIYTFPQVHQMISSISGELQAGNDFVDIIRALFPMGSMTGAPKHRVLELIERYEETRRGLFSGAVGYLSPDGNFDFNVVIRSILYNAATQYLSCMVGSGITFYSNAEEEYEECELKAKAIREVLASL